jgi:hypothetical protein
MTAQIPGLTGEEMNALEILAGHPNGCPESEMKAKGFTIGLLGGLIRAGLATATRRIVETGGRGGETGDHGQGADDDRSMTFGIGFGAAIGRLPAYEVDTAIE